MGDRVLQGVINYLRNESYNFCVEWVEGVVDFFLSENEHSNTDDLHKFVVTQWLLADLCEQESPCLPPQLENERCITLPGKYSLQVISMLDISTSCYTQYQQHTNADNANTEVRDENTFFKEPKANRMYMISLTDGVQNISAVEHEPIKFLTQLIPGSKVMITGPVVCRRGAMLLTERHLKILGGEVESLLIRNAYVNILARQLNLDENPDPYNQQPPQPVQVRPPVATQQGNAGDWGDTDIGMMGDEIEDIERRILQEEEDARDAFSDDNDEEMFVSTNNTTQMQNLPTTQRQNLPTTQRQTNERNIPQRQNIGPPNVANDNQQRQSFPDNKNISNSKMATLKFNYSENNKQPESNVKMETISLVSDDEDDECDFLQSINELDLEAIVNQQQNVGKIDGNREHVDKNFQQTTSIKSSPSEQMTNVASCSTAKPNKTLTVAQPSSDKTSTSTPKITQWLSTASSSNASFQSASSSVSKQPKLTTFMSKDKMSSSPNSKSLMASNKPITIGTTKSLLSTKCSAETNTQDDNNEQYTNQVQVSSAAYRQKIVDDGTNNSSEMLGTVNKIKLCASTSKLVSQGNESKTLIQATSYSGNDRCLPTMLSDPCDMEQFQGSPKESAIASRPKDVGTTEQLDPVQNVSTCSQPFVYLLQLKQCPPTSRRTYTVKATVVTLVTKVSWNNKRWNITVKITDGSAVLDVRFGDEVMDKIMGFSVAEFAQMKKGFASNPLVKEKIVKAFYEAQLTLVNLSCLFVLEYDESSNMPEVMELIEVTEKHHQELVKRLQMLSLTI